MLGVPHEAQESQPFLLLRITPCSPVVFEIVGSVFQGWRSYTLTVAAPDQIDEQAVEEMRHLMLLLAGPALTKALNEKDSLKNPQIWLRRETGIGEDLRTDIVVNANLYLSAFQRLRGSRAYS